MALFRILAAFALLLAAPAAAQTVRLAQGELTGTSKGNLNVFRGIPYAAPPVGDLRWKAPAPHAPWQGNRAATEFGPSCIQSPYPAESVYFEPTRPTSEDCLTLNIWAPRNAKRAPVLVWIHGGALSRGTSASPMYDGAEFARRGVVFVSINYRLGILGWLAHPALSAEHPDGVSGNYGLLDQIAALRWTRDNIAAFGGDPKRVTVMGESAGALSITYLLTSPEARGLFARAILQSANTRAVPALKGPAFGMPSAESIGATLGDSLGARTLADLRALPTETLLRARFLAQGTIDGKTLPAQVVETFDRNQQAQVPILAGFNSGEVRSQRELVPPAPATPQVYEQEIARRYQDLAPAFLKLYPSSDMTESLLAATRDAVYGWATERMVRHQTAAGQPAYMYLFDHCYAAASARNLCAFHASELPFVFDRLANGGPLWPAPTDPESRQLAAQMIDAWAAFARTGKTGWPAYGKAQNYARLANTIRHERDPVPGMFELQEQVVARRRQRGQQWLANIGPAAPLP